MKKQLILLACALLSGMLFSQAVPMALEEWRTTAGTQNFFYRNVTKTDASGNIFVAGATMEGFGTDILVAKYNSAGVQLWIQQFQGTAVGGVDFAGGMVVTNTYVYLTGAISNNTVTPETDMVTMQLASSTGSVVWSTTYSGAGGLHDAGKAIYADGSGNVFVSGGSYNASLNTDYVVLHYNSSGVQQWVTTYDYAGFDDASSGIQNSGSNINIGGAVTTATPGVYRSAILSLAKATGSILATTTSTAVTTTSVDVVTDFATSGTDLILIGSSTVGGQGTNMYVQKFNNTLLSSWTYTYNGGSSLDDVAKGVQADASGNVYVAGFSTSATLGRELTLIKLNSSGTQQWVQTSGLSGDDEAYDLIIDASNDVYLTGYKTSTNGDKNYYTVKYDASGTKIWEVEMTGLMNDYATNITLDSLNNVINTGQTEVNAGIYNFTTVKYVQHEVITPMDFNGEMPANNFMYYTNRGQLVDTNQAAVPYIKYYTHNTYPSFYFEDRNQSFVFARIDTVVATADTLHRIDLTFTNAIETSKTHAMDEQENGYLNYFLAHTDSNGITTRGNLHLVTPNLYSNIDLMCSSNQNGIKYYFIVKPGGDMRDIKMEFTGATSFSLNGTTNYLSINSSIGSLTFDKPIAYQLTAGNATVAVTSFSPTWTTDGAANKYKFNDGTYTASLTLVIEVDQGNGISPAVAIDNLTWSTYYGGSSDDVFYDVKTNSSNHVWVTGYTNSINFPIYNAYQGTKAGNMDAIFVKFNNAGVREWSTFIGGSDREADYRKHGLEVDNFGNSYSAFPTASANFPVKNSNLPGAYYDYTPSLNISTTSADIAIISLNSNGQLVWSTYFGDLGPAYTCDIGLDNNGNLIVTGGESGIPTINPVGSYSYPFSLTGGSFIAKFSSSFNLQWSTLIGAGEQYTKKIGFNSNNDIILVGEVNGDIPLSGLPSTSFFDLKNPGGGAYYDSSYNGGSYDGIIMQFSGITNDLLWSTFYGGDEDDKLHAVIIDNSNNIFISGETNSTTNLISGNPLGMNNTSFGGEGSVFGLAFGDGFLAKFNSNHFISSTYFGGAANEGSYDITYKNNRLFIPLITTGDDLPFSNTNPSGVYTQSNNSDGQDVSEEGYFAVMDANFNFQWSTYFGGSNTIPSASINRDHIYSNVATNDNKYYIVGTTTSSSNFPLVQLSGAYYQGTKSSSIDAFIAQFDISPSLAISTKEIENKDIDDLIIYPNPANHFFNVQFKGSSEFNLELIDLFGRVVKSLEHQSKTITKIDVSNLAKGTYIVKAYNKNEIEICKLIIN